MRAVEHGRPQTPGNHRRLPNSAVEAGGSHSTEVLPRDYTAAPTHGRRRAVHGGRRLHVLRAGGGRRQTLAFIGFHRATSVAKEPAGRQAAEWRGTPSGGLAG